MLKYLATPLKNVKRVKELKNGLNKKKLYSCFRHDRYIRWNDSLIFYVLYKTLNMTTYY